MSAYQYPIHIANIRIQNEDKIRTSAAYIHSLLEEEGLNLHHSRNENEMMTLGSTTEVLSVVCTRLRDTGLYDGVSIEIGKLDSHDSNDNVGDNKVQLNITLDEKKWYKLYVGAGVKQQGFGMGMSESSQLGALPKAQFEASANVSNIRGNTDMTAISYTIDQASVPTFVLSHDAPAKISIEDMEHESWRCVVDTADYELARSYKEYHRSLSYRLSNSRSPSPFLCEVPWRSLEWTAMWRDILPCRFPNAPFACDASPNIISEAGPSLKHSLSFDYKMNGVNLDNRVTPTRGFDMSVGAEIAGPPGDVGFFKASNALSIHFPLIKSLGLCLHASFSSGFARNISFGGTCNRTLPISDRYFVGGPLNLRGFQASGIGPRAKEVSHLFLNKFLKFLEIESWSSFLLCHIHRTRGHLEGTPWEVKSFTRRY